MGALLSCCGDGNSRESGEANERTNLLSDPSSSNVNNIFARVQSGDDYLSRTPNAPQKKDEQSALSRILSQTANNVIDVGTLDNHDLGQHEYYDRLEVYNLRTRGLVRWVPPSKPGLLLIDIPGPEKILAEQPMSFETYSLISAALDSLSKAVSQIQVEHKEDLVVPFRIP